MEKFTYFTTERYKLPKYGFKIHVSATVESYEEGFLKGYEGYKFIKELRRKL
ncbi:hypothetical protein [Lactococcus cremoris]